ncbi:hypothetical protein H5410_035879 [Solanum commersonii]|uniref:Uncharacterized protein n=1 Tax=Solanum commersonii TaxID=4109 RepID=A0A9J5Y437_SOLCO|nr:hypothetical protein H5410_035879 [Solanum commersonii]
MSEPDNDWSCKFEENPELTRSHTNLDVGQKTIKPTNSPIMSYKEDAFAFSDNGFEEAHTPSPARIGNKENFPSNVNLPPKSRSPKRFLNKRLSTATEGACAPSPVTHSNRISNIGGLDEAMQELQSTRNNELKYPIGSQRDTVNLR